MSTGLPHGVDAATLRARVGDLRQLAAVRRIVLDDGPERGVRALAFTTGGGLDFWALADRTLDIGSLWWRGMPIAWQGLNGYRAPALYDAADEGGRGFNRSFSGLVVTCGLDHIRQPVSGHPLHGRLPFTPVRLLAYGEDWERAEPVLFCEGEATQARLHGEALRLHRRIEAPIGGGTIRQIDRVTNLGPAPQPHGLLYHINVGYPMLRDGAALRFQDRVIAGPLTLPDPTADSQATCHRVGAAGWQACTLASPGLATSLTIGFDATTLPYLQIWSDPRPHAHVLGIEPCTSERRPDGTCGPQPDLAPGESRVYRLEIALAD